MNFNELKKMMDCSFNDSRDQKIQSNFPCTQKQKKEWRFEQCCGVWISAQSEKSQRQAQISINSITFTNTQMPLVKICIHLFE